ncbi:XRE family transcriptional regulator [Thermomonospora cellulosilytica]|uniref:XRE family transcriptional regulator n=1 Tax=Thermomonospora cellulosilytica TaxID=1411118 RepID=A0A7W3MTR9_9ACTN|nr:XRE family transcriptional regulator [Thermomonospora cellulosilytica]MBA9001702.1 hypothetical protein [Thermomonospora cellulosilytica]
MSHPTLLAQIAAKRRWSSDDGARAFRAMAREMGEDVEISERTWHRWCRGGLRRRPRMACCRVLERMFGHPVEVLLAPVEVADTGAAHPGPDGIPDVLATAAEESTAHLAQVESLALGPVTLEQAGDDVIRLARGYATAPPAQMLAQGARLRRRIADLLPQTTRPSQHRELYLMLGELCGLLAVASFDLGDTAAATAHARAAWGYGELIEHDALRAWARGTQALLAYWEGRPGAAVRLARSGRGYVSGGTGLVRVCYIEARAHACLRDRDGALQALNDARRAADAGGGDELHDGIGGEFGFGPVRQARCESTVHVRLGDGPAAVRAARRALAAHTAVQRSAKLLRQAQADLAAGHLIQDNQDAAAEHLQDVLNVPVQHRVTGLIERVRTVHRLVGATGRPPARPLRALLDQLHDFLAAPAGRPLHS